MAKAEFPGKKEMEKLYSACTSRNFLLGMDIDPKREAKDCNENPAMTILVVATEKPFIENIILSETVVDDKLSAAATKMLAKVMEYEAQ